MNTKTKNLLKIVSFLFIGGVVLSDIPDLIKKPKPNSEEIKIKSIPIENWQDTAPGRFAHALQYEDKLPKPVSYTFKENQKTPEEKKLESENYFEHLCNTESGNYVWETVGNVDYIAYLRIPTIPMKAIFTYQDSLNEEKMFNDARKELNGDSSLAKKKIEPFKKERFRIEEYLMHRDALEAPAYFDMINASTIESELQNSKERIGLGEKTYVPGEKVFNIELRHYAPFYISSFKDRDFWYNDGTITYYKEIGRKNDIPYYDTSQQPYIQARYGVTWRGFTRPRDREFGIAGSDLIIVDLQHNNKVLAVQRIFAKANTNFEKNIYSWHNPLLCPESYKYEGKYYENKFDEKTPFSQKFQILKGTTNYLVFKSFTSYVLKHDSFVEKQKIAVNPNIKIKH